MFEIEIHVKDKICNCTKPNYGWIISAEEKGEYFIIIHCGNKDCTNNASIKQKARAEFKLDYNRNLIYQFENKPLSDDERKKLDALIDEANGKIIKTYPDEFYWINLCTSFSRYESYMLNHCGKDIRGEIWSLRNVNKVPFATIVIKDKTILQIRGKNNGIPTARAMEKIYDLVESGILNPIPEDILNFIKEPK